MNSRLLLASVCLLPLLLPSQARADEVLAAVASNFAAPMEQIVKDFEQRTGHRVRVSFGASGRLFAQISSGAPFDVFLSADQTKVDALVANGLAVTETRFSYALGRLALLSAKPREDLADGQALLSLAEPLALANPRLAPYGVAAEQSLAALGLIEATRPHWVLGENIAQTFQFVYTANATFGFVALSQLMQGGELLAQWQGRAWVVPEKLHSPIFQDAVLLNRASRCSACTELLDYLRSPDAVAVLRAYGYGVIAP